MANQEQRSQPRLRVSGVAAHVRSGSVAFSCQVEELSSGGAFLRTDQLLPLASDLDLDLVKPGARKVLHVTGRVSRAFAGGPDQHPGLEIEFDSMKGDDSVRLGHWLDEMRTRGSAKRIAESVEQTPLAPPGEDGASAKLMTQIKGLLLEMDELRDCLRLRDGEIEELRRELAVAEQLIGKRPS